MAASCLGQTGAVRHLVIVRHAKADKAVPGQRDFDRHLSEKGRAQAEVLRAWARDPHELGAYGPATALVSSSARTMETYAIAFAGTPLVHAVATTDRIYNGQRYVGPEEVLAELAAIDPLDESLLVVGHNPTVLELATSLAKGAVPELRDGEYPLAAAIVLRLEDGVAVSSGPYKFVRAFVPQL